MTSQIIIAERTVYLLPTARLFVTNLREKPWGVCVPRHLCSFFFYHDKKDTIEEKKDYSCSLRVGESSLSEISRQESLRNGYNLPHEFPFARRLATRRYDGSARQEIEF